MYREHPLKILKYSAKNIWLLIFPLLRGIWAMNLNVDKLYVWLRGAWFDILVLFAIILFGFAKWFFSKVSFTENAIVHNYGILFKIKTIIPYKSVASITGEYSFYLRPFRAVRIYADTCSGVLMSHDMKLLLSKNVCLKLMTSMPKSIDENGKVYRHKPGFLIIFFFSALFSSTFSGMIYVAAFFFQGGQIAKDIIAASAASVELLTAEVSKFLIINIPNAALTIALFIVATWTVSFIINLIRYSGFKIRRDNNTIEIESGTITPRRFLINLKFANYIDLRQNLVMKLFRVMSVNINCSGYGNGGKKNMPVLLPVQTKKQVEENLGKAVKSSFKNGNTFRPSLTSFWQYIWLSVIVSIAVFPLTYYIGFFSGKYNDLLIFIAIMVEIPSIWHIVVNIAALSTNGITIDDEYIQIKYAKGFKFHTVIGEREKFKKLSVRQTPFQKFFGKCTLCFSFNGEVPTMHKVKAIKMTDVQKIAKILFKRELDAV